MTFEDLRAQGFDIDGTEGNDVITGGQYLPRGDNIEEIAFEDGSIIGKAQLDTLSKVRVRRAYSGCGRYDIARCYVGDRARNGCFSFKNRYLRHHLTFRTQMIKPSGRLHRTGIC